MSLISALSTPGLPDAGRWVRRLALAALALLVVGVAVAGLVRAGFGPAPPAPRNPFGGGLREAAADPGGIGGALLAIQAQFSRALLAALSGLREGGSAWTLAGLGFTYGAFHAAGPGHGKAVISAYLLATRRTLRRGIALSVAASAVQATVAIGVVLLGTLVLGTTAAGMTQAVGRIELASFALLALVGAVLLWRRTAALVPGGREPGPAEAASRPDLRPSAQPVRSLRLRAGCTCCDGPHIPSATRVEALPAGSAGWRESAGIVLAAGLRPCSGAVILLVFAVSQGLVGAGIAAVLAMAAGTALTTATLAAVSVFAKRGAVAMARSGRWTGAIAWLELAAAAFVVLLGLALVLNLWSGAGPS